MSKTNNSMLQNDEYSCQEKKSINIYELNREFLGDCSDFVININKMENSPWGTDSIVHWYTVTMHKGLGEVQKKILRYLQNSFFKFNNPCFVKQSFIARKFGIHRSQINRTLKSLEDKGLLIRIQWLYKTRRKHSIILPCIPAISDMFKDENLQTEIDFQGCYFKCNKLFCKPTKLQRFPKPFILYTNILYLNKIFNTNTFNQKYLAKANVLSEKTESTFGVLKIVESKEPPLISNEKGVDNKFMINKFLLKRKKASLNSTNPYAKSFTILRRNHFEFDSLSIPDQTELNSFVSFFYGIDIKDQFKIPRASGKNDFYRDLAKHLRCQLLKIVVNGEEIQWGITDKVIDHWNKLEIDNTKFQRMSLRRDTKTYINAAIAVTHCLLFPANKNITALNQAIDRLPLAAYCNKAPFTWRSNLSISKFFSNVDIDKPLIAFLQPEIEFKRFVYARKITKRHKQRVDQAYEYFVNFYVNQFYPNNLEYGQRTCYQFESMIKQWLEERIIEIVDFKNSKTKKYRNTENHSLVESKQENGSFNPPLIQKFFYYFNNSITIDKGHAPMITEVLREKHWKSFVEVHMRIEAGYKDFYKIQFAN